MSFLKKDEAKEISIPLEQSNPFFEEKPKKAAQKPKEKEPKKNNSEKIKEDYSNHPKFSKFKGEK